jgi:glycosyltransferase involved in cell wall biosynthesis
MARFTFIAPAYQYFPVLLGSLLHQTFRDWECILVHDGPSKDYERWIVAINDPRIWLACTEARRGNWGHHLRQLGLDAMCAESEFCCVTNADNYYLPCFCGDMIQAAGDKDGSYCDMLHSHHKWRLMKSVLACSQIDCGNFVVRSRIAREVGWKSLAFAADWTFIDGCLKASSPDRFVKVDRCLFVHN